MLKWKTANGKVSTIAVQEAIASNPGEINPRELYYFVTVGDIANELGKSVEALAGREAGEYLEKLGLDCSKEVYDLSLRDLKTFGYFAPESALKRIGASLVQWKESPPHIGRYR